MKSPKSTKALLVATGLMGISVFFQNCMGSNNFELASLTGNTIESGTSVDHPGGSVPTPSTQAPLLANRYQIQSLLMDTFKDPAIADTAGNNRVLSKLLVSTIVARTGTFGLPCDSGNPILDVSSGADCDGTIVAPMNQPATTLRAAYKIQACEQILSNDVFVNNLMKKIGGAAPVIDATSINTLLSYFYRGDDPGVGMITGLQLADEKAVQIDPAIKLIDRWRLLMMVACESTGWEAL
ncbi:hypothetical protein DOM22_19865 [Bdellovibrio sp. ZAP7]|uniref:hypothetical protein n=1 Tax=Bdellovibrio sp. ZAP7 TaxID=2231053 RepID=UPI0011590427|nr:hypothetical protein [Bdellovibrio sp. ZAP7]QDK47261.1 hypothetical protein DOM22_19865 [Bdellovibrio sp. ZAP7]